VKAIVSKNHNAAVITISQYLTSDYSTDPISIKKQCATGIKTDMKTSGIE
jgi:hypothetical protein